MTTDTIDNKVLDEALSSYLALRPEGFDPRYGDHHFDGFRIFAEGVIGDTFRKIKVHAFPKVAAATDDGISIGAISLVPLRRAEDGHLYEFTVRENGVDMFVVRTLHTPAGPHRNRSSDTVVLLRPGAQYGISHADFSEPVGEFNWLRYRCHDGPGALPGLTEACKLILPFIKDEAATDTTSKRLHTAYADEYMAMVERDGGLPGDLTARFAQRLLDVSMGAIFDWIATELPALVDKVGHRMTWPHNSLCYNDQDESAVIVRAPGALGIVEFIAPSSEKPHYASMQVLRQDDNGKPVSAESYLIPIGNGEMVQAIEAFRNGEAVEGHPMMSFDFATRRVSATPAFLESKRYLAIASPIFHTGIDWKGRRSEGYEDGVHRFMEWDGLELDTSPSPSTPAL
jgi:hypothetical protein